ncbi:MAG: hypothetical protein CW348_05855 [Thermobifida sp.]|nr:hypothetical protein [Thermobifida sp.]
MKSAPPAGKLAGRLVCSPRMRGWSHFHCQCVPFRGVLPAHAGMVLWVVPRVTDRLRTPRACGDDPLHQRPRNLR